MKLTDTGSEGPVKRWWRLKYRYGGKERGISLGVCPEVSLKEARVRRNDARKLLAQGVDPCERRQAGRVVQTQGTARDCTGTYSNIIISASNGQHSTALRAFNVVVTTASATGPAALAWVPPTRNTDGSELTDLAGFRIYYGTSTSNLNRIVQVGSATQSSYTITDLPAGTWYFGCVAYTTDGIESAMSAVVSKQVP